MKSWSRRVGVKLEDGDRVGVAVVVAIAGGELAVAAGDGVARVFLPDAPHHAFAWLSVLGMEIFGIPFVFPEPLAFRREQREDPVDRPCENDAVPAFDVRHMSPCHPVALPRVANTRRPMPSILRVLLDSDQTEIPAVP
ncbi:MAG: hypothetical protein C3F17_16575 [Bradyrhizobiaceae bacterium]|nr:MAG: hypothetical protein C3F17_16575 [Bradyrhizobiaceae bacterium]